MLSCWGLGDHGEADVEQHLSTAKGGKFKVRAVSAGHQSTCVILYNLNLLCFGHNMTGKNDIPDVMQSRVLKVDTGHAHLRAEDLQ